MIWPDSSPTHYQSRSMQVPPGSHRDFDLDCIPIVVAVRQGWFILEGGVRRYHLPCEQNPPTYWKSSLILRVKEQNKVR